MTTILAIESSCDDTSAAVMRDGFLLSNVTASQAVHKAYGGVVPELASRAHQQNIVPVVDQAELRQTVLNINLDMIGTYMGKFIACVSAEEKLTHYISYMAAEVGFPIAAENGVYSSDSTPFADHGVPAVSFARIANGNVAPIHCRYDVKDVMSMEQLQKDIDFLTVFTGRFANAAVCPVAREIPETIRKQLDEYLFRKRKEA